MGDLSTAAYLYNRRLSICFSPRYEVYAGFRLIIAQAVG